MPSDPEPIRMSIPRPGTEAPANDRSIDDEGADVIRDTRNCIEHINDLIKNLRSARD